MTEPKQARNLQANPQELRDWKDAREYRADCARKMSKIDGIAQALAELGCPAPDIIGQGHIGWYREDAYPRTRNAEGQRSFHVHFPLYDKTCLTLPRDIASVRISFDRESVGFMLRLISRDCKGVFGQVPYAPNPANNTVWETSPNYEFLEAFARGVAIAREEWAEHIRKLSQPMPPQSVP